MYDGYKYVVKQKNIYNSLNEDYFNKSNLIKVNEDLDIQVIYILIAIIYIHKKSKKLY